MTNDDSAKLPPVPVGIQRLLRRAATDPAFLDQLVENPDVAASTSAVTLTPNEQAILRAISAGQLRAMVRRIPPVDVEEPATPPLPPIAPQGIRPDQPPERPVVNAITKGIRPTPIVATAAALVIGGVAVAECTGTCDRLLGDEAQGAEEIDDD